MCGIAGILSGRGNVKESELLAIRDSMVSRGPDSGGLYISTDHVVGLAHRRLSIIDLSEAGSQPMTTSDGRYSIVFNGEIYNYAELRKRLVARGYRFRSNSDTEVLLYLYAEHGPDMVRELRGMFALAIWDAGQQGLFLVRDPMGIKPLYYANNGGTFRFASQVKALLAGGQLDTAPDPAGHVGFFLWGAVPEPHTLYKAVSALPAGSTLWVDREGRCQERSYYRLAEEFAASEPRTVRNPAGELREALLDSVRHHMVADVPVGVFLSAGLDSGTLAGLASESAGQDLRSVTLGFQEYRGTEADETELAQVVANHYRTKHSTVFVTAGAFRDELKKLLRAMDQPSIDGINAYFVSKVASELGLKVALSGLGADELFGGYPSFRQVPQMVRLFGWAQHVPSLGAAFRWIAAPVLRRCTSTKYAGLVQYGGTYGGAYMLRRGLFMPWELPSVLDPDFAREGWNQLQTLPKLNGMAQTLPDHLRVSVLEMGCYMRSQLLRDADWAGMAHSLEIRVPFVDVELLRRVLPLMHGQERPTKLRMAQTPRNPLPRSVLERPKTGFNVPVQRWLIGDGATVEEHGLRGWAKTVYKAFGGGDYLRCSR